MIGGAARIVTGLAFLGMWLWARGAAVVLPRTTTPSRADRGDVPGWVMVTVMSAALVAALIVPFRETIVAAVQAAMANVTGLSGQ